MRQVAGSCRCGQLRLTARLTQPLESYCPRECDCDFCRARGAAYVSDPLGELTLQVRQADSLRRHRQGDALADMLSCGRCGALVGALYAADGLQHGVVNVQVLDDAKLFGARQTVSPRRLTAAEKITRWREIWFPNVVVRS
jgi:hypothetical protein